MESVAVWVHSVLQKQMQTVLALRYVKESVGVSLKWVSVGQQNNQWIIKKQTSDPFQCDSESNPFNLYLRISVVYMDVIHMINLTVIIPF